MKVYSTAWVSDQIPACVYQGPHRITPAHLMNMTSYEVKGKAHDFGGFQDFLVSLACTDGSRNPLSRIMAIYRKTCYITVLYHTNKPGMTLSVTIYGLVCFYGRIQKSN